MPLKSPALWHYEITQRNFSVQFWRPKMILPRILPLLLLSFTEIAVGVIPNYTECYFTQVLDHFGISNTDAFSQRYLMTGALFCLKITHTRVDVWFTRTYGMHVL